MSGKPRLRVTTSGWIRNAGESEFPFDARMPVEVITRSGSAWALRGLQAGALRGWRHSGFSGDIMAWRPSALRGLAQAGAA